MVMINGKWLANSDTQRVCAMLTDAGYQALFVGGCVRNALLKMPVGDIDIATDAHPEEVVNLAKAATLRAVPTGLDHGTVTVIAGSIPHEITTFRRDTLTDGRHAEVAFSDDMNEDARRRDFTMNALYADPTGRVLDPLGGLEDLTARRLRFIGSPTERIREDYLRILRFFRFHACYGDPQAGFDPEALAAITANLDGLPRLSHERLGAEMRKLLNAPDPAPAIASMRATGVLASILPGADDRALAPLVDLETQQGIAPDPIRRLAALGGDDPTRALRLSRAETTRLRMLRKHAGTAEPALSLGYRLGQNSARNALLLRAALMETSLGPEFLADTARGGAATFPVAATDLMPEFDGAELGERLHKLEQRWLNSGFALTREELLTGE